jgi:hypothetical protein
MPTITRTKLSEKTVATGMTFPRSLDRLCIRATSTFEQTRFMISRIPPRHSASIQLQISTRQHHVTASGTGATSAAAEDTGIMVERCGTAVLCRCDCGRASGMWGCSLACGWLLIRGRGRCISYPTRCFIFIERHCLRPSCRQHQHSSPR